MDAIIAQASEWGFGTRIFILAANQVLADTSGRAFRISWVLNDHCPGDFTDVFRIPANVSFSSVPLSGPAFFSRLDGARSTTGLDTRTAWHVAATTFSKRCAAGFSFSTGLLSWSNRGRHDLRSHDVDWSTCVGVHWRGTDRLRHVRSSSCRMFEGGIRV